MSIVAKLSSMQSRKSDEVWVPDSYLSEMRARLSKLRALQEEQAQEPQEMSSVST